MKAVLLAAGLGTRLRPITDNIPKGLVPIRGKPLLAYWLDALVDAGVESVLVNLHYLADQVSEFVETRTDRNRITLVEEPVLLGTAGTVRENCEFFAPLFLFFLSFSVSFVRNSNAVSLLFPLTYVPSSRTIHGVS